MYEKKKSVSMKVVVLLLAVVLLIGCVAGGTLAYLMANTNTVTNTFVIGEIGTLTLKENGVAVEDNDTRTFTIVPGNNLTKNVTVSYSYADDNTDKKDDVKVYVFVKVETTGWSVSNNTSYIIKGIVKNAEVAEETKELLSWSIASDWTYLTTEDNAIVYYRSLDPTDNDTTNDALDEAIVIAEDGKITVSNAITKDNINTIATAAGDITFTAYAIQQDTFADASAAWAVAKKAQ